MHWSSATFAAAGDDGDDAGGCASTASAASAAPAAPLSHGGASAAFAAGLMIMVRDGWCWRRSRCFQTVISLVAVTTIHGVRHGDGFVAIIRHRR